MSAPLVSVVIPTFNRCDLLPQTLESVLGQSFGALEVIVVDDASTDGTQAYVQGHADPRVRYIRNPWSGLPAVNRNTGIKASRGEFIAFVDSDDLWLPEKLTTQVRFMRENPGQSWCFCRHDILCHQSGQVLPGPVYSETREVPFAPHRLLSRCFIGSPTPLVRQSLLERAGLLNESPSLRFSEDWEFWLRLSAIQPGAFIPQTLALYRVHPRNAVKTTDISQERQRFMATIAEAVARNPTVYGRHKRAAMGRVYSWLIKREIVDGRLHEARALYAQAATDAARTPGLLALRVLASLPSDVIQPVLRLLRASRQLLQP